MMIMKMALCVVSSCALSITLIFSGCKGTTEDPRLKDVELRLSRLEQVPMHFDASKLSERQRELLKTLVDATRLIHEAFLRQTDPLGVKIRDSLAQRTDDTSRKFYRLVLRNGGIFDKMDEYHNFYGTFSRPGGAAFYPTDLTKEEFETYVAAHPDQANALLSPYTVVKRDGAGLKAVPFHEEYAKWIRPASELLKNASRLATSPSMQKYLGARAEALLTDDYFQSDLDWIDLKENDIDIMIGPFEFHEDGLMGIKAVYQSSVGIKDKEESAKLDVYTRHLNALEQNLPHDAKYKRSITGLSSPMVVVADIIRGGDLAAGYQAVATNLPNDPKVHSTKGTKKTFWKNVMAARVGKVIEPVGRALIASDQIEYITPQAVFNFVLMHELCHALGPLYVDGSNDMIPVNQALKELAAALEEGKADLAGLHSARYFIEQGILPGKMEKEIYVSHLASIFRTIRFGTAEPHGKAAICELNFLRDRGAFRFDPVTNKWSVDFERIGPAISELARLWLTFEATGDYNGVREFFGQWAGTTKDVAQALSGLSHLPVDVEPVYTIKWE